MSWREDLFTAHSGGRSWPWHERPLEATRGNHPLLAWLVPPPAPAPSVILGHSGIGDRPFVLRSGPGDASLSSWSYAGLDAVESHTDFPAAHRALIARGTDAPLSADTPDVGRTIRHEQRSVLTERADFLPPFTGGMVGYISYDAGWGYAARTRPPRSDPLGMASQRFHRYDAIYARDERTQLAWIIAEAHPEARERASRLRRALYSVQAPTGGLYSGVQGPFGVGLAAPVAESVHKDRIRSALELIRSGDIYQVNLSHPLVGRFEGDPAAAFVRLEAMASPFSAYLRPEPDAHVVSASPECFLALAPDRTLQTYPIKGTRRRTSHRDDAADSSALLNDPKERAEHLMIVDLLRNDLGRVAEAGSVSVEKLAYIESFPTVHHLTSCVRARLRRQLAPEDLVAGTFPGGSITGVPKLRAMEVLDRLEEEPRGIYTGSILWLDRGGGLRASIAIRTAQIRRGEVRFGVGGGIVADSDPSREWEETRVKSRALARALEG